MTLGFQCALYVSKSKKKKKKDFGTEKKLSKSIKFYKKYIKKKRLRRREKTVQVYKIKLLSVNTNFLPSTNLHALTTLIFINFLTRSDGDLHIFIRLQLTNDS